MPSLFSLLRFPLIAGSALSVGHATYTINESAIQWTPCNSSIADPSLLCGFFQIPIDYHDPSVGYGRIAVAKANATGTRRGTVFFNPGGPGLSGINALNATKGLLLNQTGGEYDIVSWDPRGVGSLTIPGDVFCFDSPEEEAVFFNGTIETHGIEMIGNFTNARDLATLRAQAPIMQEKYTELGKRCAARPNGNFLQYVGTTATVRDMVGLADALDGPGNAVNYIGLSYGTIIGSWFINMFPERVGRVILDGVVDPNIFRDEDISLEWPAKQISDSDLDFKAFFTGCALAGPENCALASASQTPLEVNNNIQTILKTGRDVWYANASAPLTSGAIRLLLRSEMYMPTDWLAISNSTIPQMAAEIAAEAQAEGVRVKKRDASDTTSYAVSAILCAEGVETNTTMAEIFEGIISSSRNVSHMFSAAWPFPPYYCPFWPVRAVERYTGAFNKTLANSILVIGNTFDPATPFFGAQAVAAQHQNQSALVRLNAFGHTSQAGRSSCINDVIRAYMVDGVLPSGNDTVCEMDDDFELWPGVNTKLIIDNLPKEDF